MKLSKLINLLIVALLLTLLLAGTALAATYDLLTGDNNHFTTGVGDWTNMRSDGGFDPATHETVDGNAAAGALQGITRDFGFPPFSDIQGESRSGCLVIDYANWPGTTKSVTFSGYVKNVSTTGITPYIKYIDVNNCSGVTETTTGSEITASGWTYFQVTVDMVDADTGWDPDSIRVGFNVAGSAEDQIFLADDLEVFSSTPTAITLQNFARDGFGLAYLAALPLALGVGVVVALVCRRRRRDA